MFKNLGTGEVFKIDFESILKSRASLLQNFTNSFARKLIDDDNRIMCFSTFTIHSKDRLLKSNDYYSDVLHNQHQILFEANRHIRNDKNNRGIKYFQTYELHKSGDLHSHTMTFPKDNLESIIQYVKVIKRAKIKKALGRVEIRLPYKYKSSLIDSFSLQYSPKHRLYFFDLKSFKSGSSIVITFFQEGKDSAKDVVRYIMKYTSKNLSYSGNKSNEYYIFRELGIRAFSYSQKVLPSVTAYQKIRAYLISIDDKYKSMYEVQKDIDLGKLSIVSTYVKKEPEFYNYKRKGFIKSFHPDYDCPIFNDGIQDIDIFVSGGYHLLTKVTVSFSNGVSFSWSIGNYSKI